MIDRKDNSQLLRKRSFVLGGLKTLFTLAITITVGTIIAIAIAIKGAAKASPTTSKLVV